MTMDEETIPTFDYIVKTRTTALLISVFLEPFNDVSEAPYEPVGKVLSNKKIPNLTIWDFSFKTRTL